MLARLPPISTLFPYTTLFRSRLLGGLDGRVGLLLELAERAGHRGGCALAGGVRELQEQRSEEHTSELQSRLHLVCRLLLEKKKDSRRGIDQGGEFRHALALHR